MARRRPLGVLSLVFAGFILLVLVSQLSSHLYSQAVLTYYPNDTTSVGQVQRASTVLAYTSAALGLVFSSAVLFIAGRGLDSEIRVYNMTGLPLSSVLRIVLRSYSLRPLVWAAVAGAVAGLVDAWAGLNAIVPILLAGAFSTLLLFWLVSFTFVRSSNLGVVEGGRGRAG